MPIKYNLTKYDMLAEKIHELAQKRDPPTPTSKPLRSDAEDEQLLKAQAILIASFCSSHSWETYKTMTEGNTNALNSSRIKDEHTVAKSTKWKQIRNMDIQQVASTNLNGMFSAWLYSISVDKNTRDLYKFAWVKLNAQFNEECDGIAVQKQH